jgi:hypothetical protein
LCLTMESRVCNSEYIAQNIYEHEILNTKPAPITASQMSLS